MRSDIRPERHWLIRKIIHLMTSDHKDNILFRSVLAQLIPTEAPKSNRKVYVVVDTYRIDFAKAVQAWLLMRQDEVDLVCLPTYAPQLNPVEHFWKQLRRQITHNHFLQMRNDSWMLFSPFSGYGRFS